MSAQSNAPIIYKKVKKVEGGGHHGGAWKIAYADFVTAMMAFFLLMWLLNATTEKQRKGIADYFSPTIPLIRVSGGGDGSFGGDSVFVEEKLAHNGDGGLPSPARQGSNEAPDGAAGNDGPGGAGAVETQALEHIEEVLAGRSGESMVSDLAQRHIVTELTDEGLVVELHDIEGEPLFRPGTAEPEPILGELVAMLSSVFDLVKNPLAVEGFVAAQPVVLADNPSWEVSGARADTVRRLLEETGLEPGRSARVTGHADRKPAARNPMAVRNNRIEIILLRTKR